MIETFLTTVSIIWLVGFVISVGTTAYEFSKLTPRQQSIATVNIGGVSVIGALLSAAWLITMVLT